MPTLADDLKREAEALRRRFVHHTRPRGLLTMDQAIELCARMEGEKTMPWTAERIAALPEGPQFGMKKVTLTPEESAKGEKAIGGGRSVTFTPGIRTLNFPDPRPTMAIFLEDDDVQSYVDSDGVRWSLGRFADGEWFRQRRP